VLHVTNGDSTGDTLRQTTLGGDVLPWRDVLHDGPVPDVPAERMREVRAAFLADCGWGRKGEILADMEFRDRLVRTAVAEGGPVVLWFEHDLYDQLQLLQVLALLDSSDGVELIQTGTFLGELSADELEALWPRRAPVTDELVALARRAWDAVRAPEPIAIETFLDEDTSALPFLAGALRRLLEELPDTRSGVSRTELQLLEALADGPKTRVEAFLACAAREEAPFAGDIWVFRMLSGLGPLVTAGARVELTDEGRAVLAGAADRVELLGIDRWVGGTHLVPGRVWRWSGSEVVAP
jgi:uncharacterized protein DUF1835